jgi:hypothetical protein
MALALAVGFELDVGGGGGVDRGPGVGRGDGPPDGAGAAAEPAGGTTRMTVSWIVTPVLSDSTSVTRTTLPGTRLAGTWTVAGMSTGPAMLRRQSREPAPDVPAGPAGQVRSTTAPVGDALASTTAFRARG